MQSFSRYSIFFFITKLPRYWISVFDYFFTARLWSARGFFRSCLASLLTVTILVFVWYSSVPDNWHLQIVGLHDAKNPNPNTVTWSLVAIRQLTPGARARDRGHGDPQPHARRPATPLLHALLGQ